jgi:hypothetical protein
MHLFLKAFYKTNGATQLHILDAPINMCHVCGDGLLASLHARYVQVGDVWAGHDSAAAGDGVRVGAGRARC